LVETALLMPVLLLILAGGYICCRSAFLISSAETAARNEAYRSGRRLPGIEKPMSESILPGGEGIAIHTANGGNSRLLPSPFPSLAGRTKGIVEVSKPWDEAGWHAGISALQTSRIVEASVDSWDMKSSSGRKIRGFVSGSVATGFLR
jgi:hypothetical protein